MAIPIIQPCDPKRLDDVFLWHQEDGEAVAFLKKSWPPPEPFQQGWALSEPSAPTPALRKKLFLNFPQSV
jgi:hypothetical protein